MVSSVAKSGRTLSLLLTFCLGLITVGLLAYAVGLLWLPATSTNTGGVTSSEEGGFPTGAPDYDKGVAGDEGGTATDSSDQLVVKTASVDMTVKDLDKSTESVRKYAKEVGGYVESLYDTGEDAERAVTITIRVPAAAFDSTIKRIKDLGVDIITSNENTDDITLAYKDLEARLKNQKALESQLLDVLDIATKVSDILEVQSQLFVVREEIETLQAAIDYYDSQVDMSSIIVYMSQSTEALDVTAEPWRPVGVFKEALASLVYVLKSLGSFLIWIVVFSPLVLVPWWIYKAFNGGKKG